MKISMLLLLAVQIAAWAQNDSEIAESCHMSIVIKGTKPAAGDLAGNATIEVRVINEQKNPIPGKKIRPDATGGTFGCQSPFLPPDSSASTSSGDDCFTTDSTGVARFYLTNIPFNTPVTVKTITDCGDNDIGATGSLIISRRETKSQK